MAGTNGPTSAAGTTDTPNPEGGAVEQTGADGEATKRQENKRQEKAKEKGSQDQNEDG